MLVLGIETSCDETAAAVVSAEGRTVAETLLSQIDQHRPYGGVVPEIAARAHLEHIDRLIARTMADAGIGFGELAAVAACAGPGLIGGLIVGVTTAKAIAIAHSRPFLAINHLEGHALSARLSGSLDFPYLLLLVSGGHCQLLIVEGVGHYRRLGTTIDDALGEAFDKVAKMLGLGFPGGPAIEQASRNGDARRFSLPRPMVGRSDCHFSFSGLKTAVRHLIAGFGLAGPSSQDVADVCAGFQAAAADCLVDRTRKAFDLCCRSHPDGGTLVVAGGVAANGYLRGRLQQLAGEVRARLVLPPPSLCTDNGVMIAWAGIERMKLGLTDGLDFAPRPRWPLDPNAPPAAFAGMKA